MKKNHLIVLAASLVIAGGLLGACGNKKQGEADKDNNNNTEQLEKEAVDQSFTPGDKETALDSLKNETIAEKAIDEMVQAVENPVKGINGTKYDAAFFNNPKNKADKASADKYAQTPSGLKYVIAQQGSGISPKATDNVTVHYVGTLTDGTQFDSSIDRGEPTSFPLNRVIPGWTEGLQLMNVGGVAVFYIPSDLAYGPNGIQNPYTGEYSIPPSAPLLFWVQLLQVN